MIRILSCLMFLVPALALGENWPNPASMDTFVIEMEQRHGFGEKKLRLLFSALRPNNVVLKAIAPREQAEARSWQQYRARFLSEERIIAGVRFWQRNAGALKRAEAAFGVPPEIIVAIIGVETEYGRTPGQFGALEALATLAFAYPPRAAYFRSELEQFLLLARENKMTPETIKGSFAGALGIPQFMPGSQRKFAVDFDGDGRIDLLRSVPDAIGSVASFIKQHGWRSGERVADRLPVAPEDPRLLLAAGFKPSFYRDHLVAAGVREDMLPAQQPVALIGLVSAGDKTEFWWCYHNFYVISRYNRSSFYAMSVMQLAEEIMQRRGRAVVGERSKFHAAR